MSVCKKCGNAIAFKKLASGRWCPTNPDGTDHWDLCKGIDRTLEGAISSAVKEQPGYTRGKGITHVWDSDMPPWDDSLGPYRDFTPQEKAERQICRALTAADRRKRTYTAEDFRQMWGG